MTAAAQYPGDSEVDIGDAVEAARAAAAATPSGDPYHELMACYAQLGALLDSGRTDPGLEVECRDLVDRLIALGDTQNRMYEQQMTVWCAATDHLLDAPWEDR